MGRKSARDNKNVYHIAREDAGLTREAAGEKLFLSTDRIEKIETRGSVPHPDEVMMMSDVYRDPMLCNYYCAHECAIGRALVPEIQSKDIAQITLEVLAGLNRLTREKERLIEITVGGIIHEDEVEDFRGILSTLDNLSGAVDSLKMWLRKEIAAGNIDSERFSKN